jgi:hypothetical protein
MTIQDLRYRLEQKKGEKSQVLRTIAKLEEDIEEGQKSVRSHEKAKKIIQEVALKTQQQLSYNISGIASMALETVFDTPYELHLEFVERRSKTECDKG